MKKNKITNDDINNLANVIIEQLGATDLEHEDKMMLVELLNGFKGKVEKDVAEDLKQAFSDRFLASDIPEGQCRRFYNYIKRIIKDLTGDTINEKLGFYPSNESQKEEE